MLKDITLRVTPDIAYENERLAQQVARELKLDRKRIKRIDPVKRSIDARQRQIMVNLSL